MVLCEKTTETIFFGLIIGPRVRYEPGPATLCYTAYGRRLIPVSRCPKVLLCYSFVTGKAKGGKKYKAKVTCCFSNASNGFDRLEENKPIEGVLFTCAPLNIFHALLFVVALLFSLSSTILDFLRKASTFSFLS